MMRRGMRTYLHSICFKKLNVRYFLLSIALVTTTILTYYSIEKNKSVESGKVQQRLNKLKRDWHDAAFMQYESKRVGIGEHGVPADFNSEQVKDLLKENGYNAALSDTISVNRSVPDIRHEECRRKMYSENLPPVSVVIPFFDEHLSTLLRTIHSIINRTPEELLLEVILVDDGSFKNELRMPLTTYLANNFPIVKTIHQPERFGLIQARLVGAKASVGEVLVFLDAHVEVNYNWLPPLLEPIVEDYKTCVCPLIDSINCKSFEYRAQDNGARGAFNWFLNYTRLPLLPETNDKPAEPYQSPVMAGGLFAISAKFFWYLGGYDEALDIWGGEQYELSFKIWQCGGQIYEAPCSRVGHIYRNSPYTNPRHFDTLTRNLKRVAEVWMDEYREYLYDRDRKRFAAADVGDISKQLALREKLQCRSFKWFMETVAFDIPKYYPMDSTATVIFGKVRPLKRLPTKSRRTFTLRRILK